MKLCEQQNEKFMDQIEDKDNEITSLKEKYDKLHDDNVSLINELEIANGFMKSHINELISTNEEGEIVP